MNKLKLSFFLLIPFLTFSQQYTIEQYLNIRGAGSPQYSNDDNRIYFTSPVTGSSQVWMMNQPGSWPFQVTYFNDRVSSYSFSPKQNIIAMEKDIGGSEYSNIYLLTPDGTGMEQLTISKPKVQYNFSRWFDDGTWFTYFSNERNPYYYDIYKYNINSRTNEQIFSSDHSNYPSVISPDGNLIVITRSYTSYDNDLILYNITTKEQKIISKHDSETEPAEFYALSFSADGKKIFVNTNYRNEYYSLHEYDIESDKLSKSQLKYYKSISGELELQWAVFNDTRTKAFFIMGENEFDKSSFYDFNTDKIMDLDPMFLSANINTVEFAHNSPKALVSINTASSPSAIYEWNYEKNTVLQATFLSFAGIDPKSFVEPEIMLTETSDKLQIRSLVYYPKNFVKDGTYPCIISAHGGPEGQARYGFSGTIQYYVNAGYVVIEPNVRGSTGYGKKFAALDNVTLRENSVRDVAELVESIVNNKIADPKKIAIMGGSYGGYMVLACLTLYPDLFAAGIDIVGISNFITFLQNTAEYRRKNREGEYGSLERDSLFLAGISPVRKVDRIKAPLFIIHGRNDPRVPVGEATQMYEAIKGRGGDAELLIYDDEGHGLAKLKNRLDAYPKIVGFLDKYVKNK